MKQSRKKADQPVQASRRKEHPELSKTGRDRVVTLAKGLLGILPYVGTGLAEMAGYNIRNQQLDRIVQFLTMVEERTGNLEEIIDKVRHHPLMSDLFEDGLSQAVRAVSNERMKFIAQCVDGGINDETKEYIESKRILRVLSELDDGEIVFLAGQFSDWPKDWYQKHKNILAAPEDRDRKVVYDAARDHLIRLGLLWYANRFEGDRYRIVTDLGRLLLRRIGVIGSKDEPLSAITIEIE